MQKKYVVRLTAAERELLHCLVKKPRVSAQKVLRARVLLKTDADGPNWTDAEIAHAFDCRTNTIENIRERFVTAGFEITLNGQPKRRVRSKILDGDQEAKIIALRLGPPPPGFANWTLRLLAEQAVVLDLVEAVSHETLRRTLKKIVSQQGRSPIGSFRRTPMPNSPRAWRKCSMSTPGPTMRSIPCCAWMSSPYSY
jgi:Homeodomain-like domain